MKKIAHLPTAIAFLILIFMSGCDNFCFGDNALCFMDEIEIKERLYQPDSNTFTLNLEADGEFNSHQFSLKPLQTLDEISFGVYDAAVLRKYTAIKKVHVLSASAQKTYQEKYVIPGKNCPVSFMHQNLQSLLLIPANDDIARQLETYDIPFDGRGTPFKLQGHFMQQKHSYFVKDGEKITQTLPRHENAMSNFGSAHHKLHYFLVTEINL